MWRNCLENLPQMELNFNIAGNSLTDTEGYRLVTNRQLSCWKVMFSHASTYS